MKPGKSLRLFVLFLVLLFSNQIFLLNSNVSCSEIDDLLIQGDQIVTIENKDLIFEDIVIADNAKLILKNVNLQSTMGKSEFPLRVIDNGTLVIINSTMLDLDKSNMYWQVKCNGGPYGYSPKVEIVESKLELVFHLEVGSPHLSIENSEILGVVNFGFTEESRLLIQDSTVKNHIVIFGGMNTEIINSEINSINYFLTTPGHYTLNLVPGYIEAKKLPTQNSTDPFSTTYITNSSVNRWLLSLHSKPGIEISATLNNCLLTDLSLYGSSSVIMLHNSSILPNKIYNQLSPLRIENGYNFNKSVAFLIRHCTFNFNENISPETEAFVYVENNKIVRAEITGDKTAQANIVFSHDNASFFNLQYRIILESDSNLGEFTGESSFFLTDEQPILVNLSKENQSPQSNESEPQNPDEPLDWTGDEITDGDEAPQISSSFTTDLVLTLSIIIIGILGIVIFWKLRK